MQFDRISSDRPPTSESGGCLFAICIMVLGIAILFLCAKLVEWI